MPYLIEAHDAPDTTGLRAETRPQHVAYLEANLDLLLAAGAMLDDEGTTADGSYYLLDIEDRSAAESFIESDPYRTAGVFGEVRISRCRAAFFDRRRTSASVAA